MQVIVGLILLALMIAVGLAAALVTSLIMGAIAAGYPRTRFLAPLFFVVVPATFLGAGAGGAGMAHLANEHNPSAMVYAVGFGLLAGGFVAFVLGAVGATLWWRGRIRRTAARRAPAALARG